MSIYRFMPRGHAPEGTSTPPLRSRIGLILGATALAHGALLGAAAWTVPEIGNRFAVPRVVTVQTWHAVSLEGGETGWALGEPQRARIR
jgi:hypothetical protein